MFKFFKIDQADCNRGGCDFNPETTETYTYEDLTANWIKQEAYATASGDCTTVFVKRMYFYF